MSVKRFDPAWERGPRYAYCMEEHPTGDYILASDYDALASRLAAAVEAMRKARERIRSDLPRLAIEAIDAFLAGEANE